MTEIALRAHHNNGGAVAAYEPATAAIASLADWASELDAAGQIAVKLCQTPFVPQHFRGKPADAAAAVLTGHELGLSPMASLRSIFMISGTPGMYAKSMVAIVLAQGHQVWVKEQSDERVVVCGQRKGSDHVFTTTWDRARVVKAKLTNNAKYQENPQQMLYARASSEICRQVAPDALLGIPYSVEELEDMPQPMRVEASVAPRVTREEILGQPPAAVDEIAEEHKEHERVEAEAEAPTRPAGTITAAQQKMLHALLRDTGRTDRDVGLVYIIGIIDREIESTKELSKADAGKVIDALTVEAAGLEPTLDEDGA